jgi:hypothetical protein
MDQSRWTWPISFNNKFSYSIINCFKAVSKMTTEAEYKLLEEKFKQILTSEAYERLLKKHEIQKKYFVKGGAIASAGCNDPKGEHINTFTLYENHPKVKEIEKEILQIDPQAEIDWDDSDYNRTSQAFGYAL